MSFGRPVRLRQLGTIVCLLLAGCLVIGASPAEASLRPRIRQVSRKNTAVTFTMRQSQKRRAEAQKKKKAEQKAREKARKATETTLSKLVENAARSRRELNGAKRTFLKFLTVSLTLAISGHVAMSSPNFSEDIRMIGDLRLDVVVADSDSWRRDVLVGPQVLLAGTWAAHPPARLGRARDGPGAIGANRKPEPR